jgi:23S rRNA (guanosine2251-2'-O)-methyltransferase
MPRPRPKPNATPDDLAFGINACEMALRYGAARSLSWDDDTRNPRVRDLVERARTAGVAVQAVDTLRLDQLTAGGVHQGVLVRLRTLESIDLRAEVAPAGPGLVLLLDGITDPQNVGAILRTAVAVGARAIVLPLRRGALLTPGVHRASAGLSFVAPVASPQNLASALRDLKAQDYWIVAARGEAEAADATAFEWPARTALVLGSEGAGLSHLLRQEADFAVRLPMDERVESLNVAVAAGALCYLWRARWPAEPGPVVP